MIEIQLAWEKSEGITLAMMVKRLTQFLDQHDAGQHEDFSVDAEWKDGFRLRIKRQNGKKLVVTGNMSPTGVEADSNFSIAATAPGSNPF